jgi:toxin ParE1/3/4
MTSRVIRSDRAEVDLVSLLVERAVRSSLRSAERLAAAIQNKCDHYARLPLTGIPRQDLSPGLRCFPVLPFLVFYRPIRDGIEVARILHGRRNITRDLFTP